jgi:purine-nucleoside phosphorylase
LFSVPSPLIGVNIQQLGTRFPDMSEIYSSDLRNIIKQAAQDLEIPSMRVSIYSFPPEL